MNALMRSSANSQAGLTKPQSQSPLRPGSNGRGTSAGENRLESAFARSPLQSRGPNSSYYVKKELERMEEAAGGNTVPSGMVSLKPQNREQNSPLR